VDDNTKLEKLRRVTCAMSFQEGEGEQKRPIEVVCVANWHHILEYFDVLELCRISETNRFFYCLSDAR
jgi:hypothetical protein